MKPVKNDKGKPRFDLVPPHGIQAVARVMGIGAEKYGDDNYLKGDGIEEWRLIRALEGHDNAYKRGEKIDPETGESHLAHAACNTLMILEIQARKPMSFDVAYTGKEVEPENFAVAEFKHLVGRVVHLRAIDKDDSPEELAPFLNAVGCIVDIQPRGTACLVRFLPSGWNEAFLVKLWHGCKTKFVAVDRSTNFNIDASPFQRKPLPY